MKKWLSLFVFFNVLSLLGLSFAQTGEKTDESSITLEEVIVTATRQKEKLSSVPANVTVITEKDIKNSSAKNIPELLRG